MGGLFRSIHTVKGMAATMGFTGVAELAHRMESLLDGLRQARLTADAGTFELLFRAVDALGRGVEGRGRAGAAAGPDARRRARGRRERRPDRPAGPGAGEGEPPPPPRDRRARAPARSR